MEIHNINFKDIGNQPALRFDVGYRTFFDIKDAQTWHTGSFHPLSDVLTPISSGKILKGKDGVLEDEEYLVDLCNIIRRYDCLKNVYKVSQIGSDKTVLLNGDIVIPKMQPCMGNIFTNPKHNRYIGSSELIEYTCNQELYIVKFLFYLLTHPRFESSLLYTESGKTHRRVSPSDLLRYKLPHIDKNIQLDFLSEISILEKKIDSIRRKLKSITDTINDVFSERFDLDFTYSDIEQNFMIYRSSFDEFANEELKFDISLKYRNIFREFIYKPSTFAWNQLGKITTVKGGKRLPKGEDVLEEQTDYKYIRVDDLDFYGRFDLNNIKYISEKNHNKIANYIALTDDILITIVGATIGKCGVVPEELNGENISENFARLIIKDKKAYSSLYVVYALMSKIGQYQINEYKGRGSQGKLAIFRIKKILVPDIPLIEQKKVVSKIHREVQKQTKYIDKMEKLRNEIDCKLNKVLP